MSLLRSGDLERLLKAKAEQEVDDGAGDVVFALFLEPHPPAPDAPPPTMFDRVINFAVNNLQPSPVMTHVELFVPCAPGSTLPVHFATYIGGHAAWRTNRANNENYYLVNNANRWRAVPVFSHQASRKVRNACNECDGTHYSLLRYATAAWGLRSLSKLVPDSAQSPAHCATLTARILRKGAGSNLTHPSAWYGPASLYGELTDDLRAKQIAPESTQLNEESLDAVERILRDSDEGLKSLTDTQAMNAIRALTLKAAAAEAFGDGAAQVLTQKQLATALMRWSVHRNTRDAFLPNNEFL